MYSNPPPEVAALKTMLVASATWAALAGAAVSTSIHYPSLSTGDSASPDPEPSLLIDPNMDEGRVVAPGIVVPDGTISVMLRQKEVNAAAIEKTARAIANEVVAQVVGLPLVGYKVGLCSMPRPEDRAAQGASDDNSTGFVISTRTISIIFTYSLG